MHLIIQNLKVKIYVV